MMTAIESVWKTNGMGIRFSDPKLTPFPSSDEINDISDAIYFYYTIQVFDRETVLFETRTHDYPKVNEFPMCIDDVLTFDMSKALLTDEYQDADGLKRYTRIAMTSLEDWVEMEYVLRLERHSYFVRPTPTEESLTGMTYTATISDHTKGLLVPSYTFSNLGKEDLVRLKQTAEEFCQKALTLYEEEKKSSQSI